MFLAWDAVGAQIEPFLVQHAYWQRTCGVALGCRSLNSRGIKMLRRAAVFFSLNDMVHFTFFCWLELVSYQRILTDNKIYMLDFVIPYKP